MEEPLELPIHLITGEALLEMLRRVHEGEDPEMVYVETYVNSKRLSKGEDE